jgi:hypothetical protein
LLLPILIKFIPTLLPSSFNENLQNENWTTNIRKWAIMRFN